MENFTPTAASQIALDIADEIEQRPALWTQGARAKNAEGQIVGVNDPTAVSFCAIGLMQRAASWQARFLPLYYHLKDTVRDVALEHYQAQPSCQSQFLAEMNDADKTTAKDAAQWFRAAHERLKERGL
jgi:hypothetical protein